ncbi:hypothetical protein GCM10009835_22880 [Planosporangium flavigriseum]
MKPWWSTTSTIPATGTSARCSAGAGFACRRRDDWAVLMPILLKMWLSWEMWVGAWRSERR